MSRASFVGIVNLTRDSFSDGGQFLEANAAIAHGERLREDGADWLDLGAESSNPEGAGVPVDEQIMRLSPVIRHFVGAGVPVSVDTPRAAVMRAAIDLGATMVNDITALSDPAAVALLAAVDDVKVVLMHARAGSDGRAAKKVEPHREIARAVGDFFVERVDVLEKAGIARGRLLLDPGMGFFLGANPEPSLAMLQDLRTLVTDVRLACPIYVSCSRKSFIGAVLGGRPPAERAFGTVAAELVALEAGATFVRTHDVRAIKDAWAVWRAIRDLDAPGKT